VGRGSGSGLESGESHRALAAFNSSAFFDLTHVAAIVFAAASISTVPAQASRDVYQHNCYAGCCLTCQGSLCCYDQPPLPDWPDQAPQ